MQEKLREPFRWRRSNVRGGKDSAQIYDLPRWPAANIVSLVIRVDSFLLEIQHNGASNLKPDRQTKRSLDVAHEWLEVIKIKQQERKFSLSPFSCHHRHYHRHRHYHHQRRERENGKETMRVYIWCAMCYPIVGRCQLGQVGAVVFLVAAARIVLSLF